MQPEKDEFDEGLEDDDFEAALSGPCSASAVPTVTSETNARQRVTVATESDDEFGDGMLDDADFEAAVTATQSLHNKSSNLIPVRTEHS